MELVTNRAAELLTKNRHVLDFALELCVREDDRPRLELTITTDLDPSDYKSQNWTDLLKAVQQYLKSFGAAHVVRFKRAGRYTGEDRRKSTTKYAGVERRSAAKS